MSVFRDALVEAFSAIGITAIIMIVCVLVQEYCIYKHDQKKGRK